MIHFHHASSPAELALDLARYVAECLRAAVAQRGQALLIVSGGSTPVPFFEALSEADLAWAKVTVTLADERWLPAGHADSNERLVRAHLLRDRAREARFVSLYNGKDTDTDKAPSAQGLARTEAALAALSWPADVVVLGMGGDGHTASLFPHSPEVLALASAKPGDALAGARCMAVSSPAAPNVPVPRLTLTPQALLDARQLIVHITGEAKLRLLEQAQQAGAVSDLPIRLALQQTQAPCVVFHSP